MEKIHLIDKEAGVFIFTCPGCGHAHSFRTLPYTDQHGKVYPVWNFNGDLEKPSFSPSLLVNASIPGKRCHLFLKEGQLQFLSDCNHELAGKTVDCPNWED